MNIADQTLDVRGLNCPLPILKTRKAMNALIAGQTLQVTALDSGFAKDIGAFCQQTGSDLVSSKEKDNEYIFIIRKL